MSESNFIENDEALKFFNNDNSLISATVKSFHIYELDGYLTIDMDVVLLYAKINKDFRIRFRDVIEYSFYHNHNYYFYDIANVKFFKEANLYYLSLDPDDTSAFKSDQDNDYILSNKIQAFSLGNM